jgi:hypothetical protein
MILPRCVCKLALDFGDTIVHVVFFAWHFRYAKMSQTCLLQASCIPASSTSHNTSAPMSLAPAFSLSAAAAWLWCKAPPDSPNLPPVIALADGFMVVPINDLIEANKLHSLFPKTTPGAPPFNLSPKIFAFGPFRQYRIVAEEVGICWISLLLLCNWHFHSSLGDVGFYFFIAEETSLTFIATFWAEVIYNQVDLILDNLVAMAMLSAFFVSLDIESRPMKWFGLSLNGLFEDMELWDMEKI